MSDCVVRIVRYQSATFSGRTLGSVRVDDNHLVVTKKRRRGNVYESQRFPLSKVIAYCSGDGPAKGGPESTYATVLTNNVIAVIEGERIATNPLWITVIDRAGVTHTINEQAPDTFVSVIEGESPLVEPVPAKVRGGLRTRYEPSNHRVHAEF